MKYQLPSGEGTDSDSEYLKAWKPLIAEAERYFPGYKVRAFDPNLSLIRSHAREKQDIVDLSLKALYALRKAWETK